MGNKIAVITGASGGMGKELLRLIAKKQGIDELWAIARNGDRLDMLHDELGDRVRTFPMDLSNKEKISEFELILEKEKPNIKYLVNCAGYAKFCSYDELNIDNSLNMIDLNICGLVAMGLACIPYMQEGSKIINIASQAAFQPLPYLNIYSATKAFVRNYSRALNVELKERGITVTAVCPGWMNTAFIKSGKMGAKKSISRFVGMVSPDKVAMKALDDADMGKDMSVYGLYVKMAHLAAKLLPQGLMMRIWLIQQRIK